ncbi:MAG: Asp23/Gls24 family envelope stress response protein [Clostridia bacterium]|nr:Asp23/Gls24 family envelope stress response protein [Clostridia bacterium]
MIRYETRLGSVIISNEYFAKLIGNAVTSCYGVSSMVATGTQWWRSKLTRRDYIDTGIVVSGNINQINVDLHIMVVHGMNINAIAESIVHKVKYTVEEATGISVNKITVHVDGMKSE